MELDGIVILFNMTPTARILDQLGTESIEQTNSIYSHSIWLTIYVVVNY